MESIEKIAAALSKAQAEMGKAIKTANNPHFRSKYADLGNVMDACLPALNQNGIAVVQPSGRDDLGDYVDTLFIHSSGQSLTSRVYLVVDKQNMQGVGSASTYARRYGLMGLAGIAPEDDDGNAAAAAPPKPASPPRRAPSISAEQFMAIQNKISTAGADTKKLLKVYNAATLEEFPVAQFDCAMKALDTKIKQNAAKADPIMADEIPY